MKWLVHVSFIHFGTGKRLMVFVSSSATNTDDSVLKPVSVLKQAETTNLNTSRIFF